MLPNPDEPVLQIIAGGGHHGRESAGTPGDRRGPRPVGSRRTVGAGRPHLVQAGRRLIGPSTLRVPILLGDGLTESGPGRQPRSYTARAIIER